MGPSLQRLIKQALREDIGAGDITSRAVIPADLRIRARLIAKAPGIVAGAQVAGWVFQAVDRRIRCTIKRADGKPVRAGQAILEVSGPAWGILEAERVALNFLGHLSGIATLTNQFVRKIRGTRARILDTRKTLPGLRLLEKYAVRVGGGRNHRFGLHDAVLIKTNHLKALKGGEGWRVKGGGIIQEAVKQAKRVQPRKFIEIEVANLREFQAALCARPNAILLDNWKIKDVQKAVNLRNRTPYTLHPTPLLEVSGGVTLQNVRRIARTGVECISIGRLTHSAPALDVSLKVY